MFPTFIAKTTGFLFMASAVIFGLGGFAQINPIWQFGQYEPYQISYAVQPDWYMGWLDGALRIMPSWEWVGWGHTIPLEVFLPAVIFPGLIFNILIVWPFIESSLDQGPGVPQPARPAAGPSQADGGRCGHADAPVRGVLRLVDRRHGQLLPAAADGRTLVLPFLRAAGADRGVLRHLQDLSRDNRRRGDRQAEAGPRGGPLGRGRVLDDRDRSPARATPTRNWTPSRSRPSSTPTDPELATAAGVRRVIR